MIPRSNSGDPRSFTDVRDAVSPLVTPNGSDQKVLTASNERARSIHSVATANSEADSNRETHSCPRVRGLGRDMVDDLVWAYRQSDDFMLHFMSRLPCCFCLRRMDMEMLREEARWVRWNPVFPFAVLGCVICMALGKWFHAVFRQGTKVRDDESDLERRVRTWWVYTYSGGFVCTPARLA